MKKLKAGLFILAFWGVLLCGQAVALSQDVPQWLKRIEYSVQYETDKHPTFYFQMVQPLYQSEDKVNTFFYQPRISLRNDELTYNVGVGYRHIVSDHLLLGANIFGDYQDTHEHGRWGIGLEALGQIFELRANGYFRITNTRVVADTLEYTTYERVANGADVEVGMPVPYLPWLKVYASSFWYDFSKFSDKFGWKTRLEAKLNDALTLEFYTWDDNKGKEEYGGRVRFNFAFDRLADFKKVFSLSKEMFPKKDLSKQTLIPVERNFDIVVEKWSESKTGASTIEIGRAD